MDTMPSQVMKHPLTYVRFQRGWSLRDTSREIARSAGQLGINMSGDVREKVWRWENRGVTPDHGAQQALAYALGVPEHLIELLRWPRWLPGAHDVCTTQWTVDGCLAALQAVEDADVDRRGFLVLSSLTLASGWAEADPDRIISAVAGGQLDDATVTMVEDRLPGLRHLDDRLGGASVLRVAQGDLHIVTELLRNSSYTTELGQRLYRLAAELGRLAGWIAFDTGLHAAAQRYYAAALHCAHTAGDRPLGAHILAGMSFQATLAGTPQDGVSLADTAADHTTHAGPRVRALIATRQARAAARAGDSAACDRALHRAEQLLASARGEEPEWIYYFDRAELEAQAGACLLDLGRHAEADTVLTRALSDQNTGYARDRTIYLVRAARARTLGGHLDSACELAGQAAELARTSHSPRASGEILRFRRSLKPVEDGNPHIAALDERLAPLAA